MWKKFKIYLILKKLFWSEKAVRSMQLCAKRCFFAIRGGGSLKSFSSIKCRFIVLIQLWAICIRIDRERAIRIRIVRERRVRFD